MSDHKFEFEVGTRVCTVLGGNIENKTMYSYGFGEIVAFEIPPLMVGGWNYGEVTAKVRLDNGAIVWGCECMLVEALHALEVIETHDQKVVIQLPERFVVSDMFRDALERYKVARQAVRDYENEHDYPSPWSALNHVEHLELVKSRIEAWSELYEIMCAEDRV